ncbi:hypothetical protein CSHISOI_10420 [Colletotrichum shisoi]|uniref:Microbial-type PARG catalytic domain-containing protein n=1 Tax=Colletotrichum shisoi TaxID=2078593 RepID=A0A5Q4BDW6_9PEZI|nr:hypothetical protein CSHISOI_10420 [Colletotrichum shisoi]
MPSSKPLKIKPSEVAADTKKKLIPEVNRHFREEWPPYSILYSQPLLQLPLSRPSFISSDLPKFYVVHSDPVDCALGWAQTEGVRIPFICAANEKRPGGDWETGVVGYEERLCRRSNLSATLATPHPDAYMATNYPIPMEGAIYSPDVVRFRQFQDRIESLDMKDWRSLPVISMPPTRWPKLTDQGRKYSFSEERELVRNKMRAALRICVFNGYNHVVIGDFGLGNGYRNPPKELAELWRDVFLYDPELRGQFLAVMFAFEDDRQCTAKCILDDIAKKTKGSSSSSSKSKSKSSSSSSSSSSSNSSGSSSSHKSDFRIFSEIFADNEIARVRSQPDPRYAFSAIMSGS